MTQKLTNYLRTHRKQSGLSQSEIEALLGGRGTGIVSRYESHKMQKPTLETALAYEVIFGVPARDLFTEMYEKIRAETYDNAKLLAEELENVPTTPEVEYKRASVERILGAVGAPPEEEAEGKPDRTRLIALDPTSHGIGFAVFEGKARLIDWGHTSVRPATIKKCLEQIEKLFALYTPETVVIEECECKESRRGPRVQELLEEVADLAVASGASVVRYSPRKVQKTFAPRERLNKHEIGKIVATTFPQLAPQLQPKRRIWDTEDERTSIFDATSFALTFFILSGLTIAELIPTPETLTSL